MLTPSTSQPYSADEMVALAEHVGIPTDRLEFYYAAKEGGLPPAEFALGAAIDACGISTIGLNHSRATEREAVRVMDTMVQILRDVEPEVFRRWYEVRTNSDLAIPRDLAILSLKVGRAADATLKAFRDLVRERTGDPTADPVVEELISREMP